MRAFCAAAMNILARQRGSGELFCLFISPYQTKPCVATKLNIIFAGKYIFGVLKVNEKGQVVIPFCCLVTRVVWR